MAEENVTLYDPTSNQIFNLFLSAEDAARAKTDIMYATTLLNHAKEDNTKTANPEATEDVSKRTKNMENLDELEASEDEKENEGFMWRRDMTLLFISLYQKKEQLFSSGKPLKKCWEEIAKEMAQYKYKVTANQCASKLASLKRTYKNIKDHNSRSGNKKRNWPFYELMDDVFHKKSWMSPIATVSSTGAEEISDVTDDDSSLSESTPKRKRSISTSLETLMTVIAEKKQQREEKKQQHAEKMAAIGKMNTLLEQLINK